MWNNNYSEAAVDVLCILKYTNKTDVKKIPKNFINFLKQHSADNYTSTINENTSFSEMNFKKETKDLLGIIYRNWWASPDEKKEIYNQISKIKIQEEQKAKELYSYENLFKTNEKTTNIEPSKESINTSLVINEENLFKKIINKIKKFFNKE